MTKKAYTSYDKKEMITIPTMPLSPGEQGKASGEQLRKALIEQLDAIDKSKANSRIIVERLDELDNCLTQLKYHQKISWMSQTLEYIRFQLDKILTEKRQLDNPRLICTCDSPNMVCQIHDVKKENTR